MSAGSRATDIRAVARKVLSEELSVDRDKVWGVLTALSDKARKRLKSHTMLYQTEHIFGRLVKDVLFQVDSPSISGRHCTISRRNDGPAGFSVYIKDTSSNGTYVNDEKLRKDSPEFRLRNGDIISLAAPPEHENAFAFVYRDVPEAAAIGNSQPKRKAEDEPNEENKRIRVLEGGGSDGPVSLGDVRRLQRSNEELRQQHESDAVIIEKARADLRAAESRITAELKSCQEIIAAKFIQEIDAIKAQLSEKDKQLTESATKSAQQQSMIDDLNKRVAAATQSRIETEEALQRHKASITKMEKKSEEEKAQWKREREEADFVHKVAMDRIRAEHREEVQRHLEAATRQHNSDQEEINRIQASLKVNNAELDNVRAKLEEERTARMNIEDELSKLENDLVAQQNASVALREEFNGAQCELKKKAVELNDVKAAKDDAVARITNLEMKMEGAINALNLERQRLEGAKERIVLRETQLRAFHATAEEIAALQKKQQDQLKAMMRTLEDEDHNEDDVKSIGGNETVGNGDGCDSKSSKKKSPMDGGDGDGEGGSGRKSDEEEGTRQEMECCDTEEEEDEVVATFRTLDVNGQYDATCQEDDPGRPEPEFTQIEATQIEAVDATQVLPNPTMLVEDTQQIAGNVNCDEVEEAMQNATDDEDDRAVTAAVAAASTPVAAACLRNLQGSRCSSRSKSKSKKSRREDDEEERGAIRSLFEMSMCTGDLLASETAGSWGADTGGGGGGGGGGEEEVTMAVAAVAVASQVATSDSERVRGDSPVRGLEPINLMASQSSRAMIRCHQSRTSQSNPTAVVKEEERNAAGPNIADEETDDSE